MTFQPHQSENTMPIITGDKMGAVTAAIFIKPKVKVVVCIAGGVLQSVYAPPEVADQIEVVLHDEDDLEGEGKFREERDAIFNERTKGLVAVA
jgi:hypothetical protein